MLLALLACTSTEPADNGCPDGMARIGDAFCIDRYEVQVTGDKGARDQYASPGGKATATSKAGVVPSHGVSFSQAMRICENSGKRLPTAQEWEDAGDGVLGDGGTLYPYGDTWDPTACLSGEGGYSETQPSGSLSTCVSPFGVYDQVGNLWEWTVGEGVVDIDAWLEKHGMSEVDGRLVTHRAQETLYAQRTPVLADADGVLHLPPVKTWKKAYLRATGSAKSAAELLPVAYIAEADRTVLQIHRDGDGGVVPDKRGCGYYTHGHENCSLGQSSLGDHFHDFDGTIGFRCVSDL
ncbi:MAG: formylglycine-generating enzyme family protein [Proteobacteria bacterium]|nr:formylglycine-generating enzyme family protein [Pseudomonadota bacterium]MCP4921634.1 formylglycine-generating enzyme family protein [Pseudomonadota bacterium]